MGSRGSGWKQALWDSYLLSWPRGWGHCIPIDPFYLSWKAREFDFSTRFIELAGEINIQASYYVVDKIGQALNTVKKAIYGSKILIMGVAYKKDIEDERESPAERIIHRLIQLGVNVCYHDPFIPVYNGHTPFNFHLENLELTKEDGERRRDTR